MIDLCIHFSEVRVAVQVWYSCPLRPGPRGIEIADKFYLES